MRSILEFLTWYYFRAPKSQLTFAVNTLRFIEDAFGVITNLVYFFKPWYGDTTLVGRIISLFIRAISIFTGLIAIASTAVLFFSIPIIWVATVVILPWIPEITVLIIIGLGYYLIIAQHKPKQTYPYLTKPHQITDAMSTNTQHIFHLYPSPLFFKELQQSSKIIRFAIKSQAPLDEILSAVQANTSQVSTGQLKARLHELSLTHKLKHLRLPHVLCALMFESPDQLQPILEQYSQSLKDFQNYIEWDEYEYQRSRPPLPFEPDYHSFTGGGTNRAHMGVRTPALDEVSIDYTKEASRTHRELRIIRPQIIGQIEEILQKKTNNNIILKGEKGTGKETFIWQIAQMILLGEFSNALWSKRIVRIDLSSLKAKGEQEGQANYFSKIRNELRRSKNIIIYIDDIQAAISQNGSSDNLLSILEETTNDRTTSLIISCTPDEYVALKNAAPRLINLSETIALSETTVPETIQITHLHSLTLENQYDVIIPYTSIKTTVNFSKDYIHNMPFPQKSINLLEDTVIASMHRDEQRSRTPWGPRVVILEKHLARTLTEKTHIPVGSIARQEADILLNLEAEMCKHIAAQDKAIESIVSTLQRNRAGVRTQTRPIGTFLFAGPTGVGKTHVAKVLANLYFGSEKTMIRLDMSEYQASDSVQRLISRENGSLIEHVRSMPFSLILLDEIEKANPSILDLFLQVLDDARLTDEHGSTCDFTQTIIIATTNAGNTQLQALPQDHNHFQNATKILTQSFRAEFLNRFDNIITFSSLDETNIRKVLDIKLNLLAEKLYNDKKINIQVSKATKDWLVSFGYSPELGARNLNRLIQDTLETKLAQKILSGEIKEGQSLTL